MNLARNSRRFYLLVFLALVAVVGGVFIYNWHVEQSYTNEVSQRDSLKKQLLGVRDGDHVYGNPDAPIRLVKYSDANCQYCRFLYPKLKSIVDSYPNEVALVYRHIPLYRFRGTIDEEELAAECVFREQGNTGFFVFLDSLFARLPSGVQVQDVSLSDIEQSAAHAGLDANTVRRCIEERYGVESINRSHQSGEVLGVGSIPHTFIVSADEMYDIVGNKPEATFRSIVESMMNDSVAGTDTP